MNTYKNKKTPLDKLKVKLNDIKFSSPVKPSTPVNLKELKRLAEEVKKTFSDEDLARFESPC